MVPKVDSITPSRFVFRALIVPFSGGGYVVLVCSKRGSIMAIWSHEVPKRPFVGIGGSRPGGNYVALRRLCTAPTHDRPGARGEVAFY